MSRGSNTDYRIDPQAGSGAALLDVIPASAKNVVQSGDALDLLRSLADACAVLGFLDPQYRELLARQRYGNEGVSRQCARAKLPAMSQDYIDAVMVEFGRVLRPSHIKPVGFIARLIAATTVPGLVVDPAAGSFVVMRALISLGANSSAAT
jgi:hypothetical protein